MPIVDPTEHHHQILHGSTPFPSLSSVGVAANSPRAVPISKHTNEMMASAFAPPSPLLNCFLPPHSVSSPQTFKASLPSSYHAIFSLKYPPSKIVFYPYSAQKKISQKRTQSWRILAATGDVLPPNTPIEETQQIVPPDDSSGSTIISVLLLIAFVGLSILTVGVIYIAVTDFFQKREREKFEKEEAAKKKKSGKKGKVKARTGPRGFGQKAEDDDE